jgi:hypothetical protein
MKKPQVWACGFFFNFIICKAKSIFLFLLIIATILRSQNYFIFLLQVINQNVDLKISKCMIHHQK